MLLDHARARGLEDGGLPSDHVRDGGVHLERPTEVDREADELAAHVREGCLSMPDPTGDSMFDHIYVEEHPVVEAERKEFAAYHAGFAEEGGH